MEEHESLAILGTHDPIRFWHKLVITKKHATTFKKCDLELDKQTNGKQVEEMTYLVFEFETWWNVLRTWKLQWHIIHESQL